MTTAVPTDRERSAVQAYLRLLHTVRATLDTVPGTADPRREARVWPTPPPVVPPSVLAEAERALSDAGLSGNEESFFRLLRQWFPKP